MAGSASAPGSDGDLAETLARRCGLKVVASTARAGGGASRDGAELVLEAPDGTRTRAYLSSDARRSGSPERRENFLREVSVLQALGGPFAGCGVRVPPLLAWDEDNLATLTGFVEGEANFGRLADPKARMAVGLDFMAQLGALHRIDPDRMALQAYGDAGEAWARNQARLERRLAAAIERKADPQIIFALDWLVRHAPAPPERVVLLHGDCGPGNFLFHEGEVTTHLDWELSRLGDPMEDLAMVCIRSLLQPFIPLPEAFRAYEAAAGVRIALDRVRYHRLSNQLGFMASGLDRPAGAGSEDPPVLGTSLVYQAMHMRVMVEQLAELTGTELGPVETPDRPPGPGAGAFETALRDLSEVIVPASSNQLAAEKAKGLARLVKFWRERERIGAEVDAREIAETSALLGRTFTDLGASRAALGEAVASRAFSDADLLQLFHARQVRETAVMAPSMGALSRTRFGPIA